MTKSRPNPEVDRFFDAEKRWQQEARQLRRIILDRGLTEELKWSKPCYTVASANVVIILLLKNYCALLFCKGALLDDPQQILVRPTENTQAARQIRFQSLQEITRLRSDLARYIDQAVEVERAGREVVYKKLSEFAVPTEWKTKLAQAPALQAAFSKLTPGRQRGYLLHFSGAKLSATRTSRIERCVPRILKGKGLNDP